MNFVPVSGLNRVGPKRERLSREQWRQRKEQARRDADLRRKMSARVESLVDAEAEAQVILRRAETKSAEIEQLAQSELAHQTRRLEQEASGLQSARIAFEHEKQTVLRETVLRVASVTARVLIGVLTGSVRFDDKRSELQFDDLRV